MKNRIVKYFEEVETEAEYNGYYYSIADAISITVPGSLCGLKNVSQIHQWAEAYLPEDRQGITIAVDGKIVRSTEKMQRYDSPLHIISAQLSEMGITFASKSVSGKSNEIPAVQELFKELDIQGCLVVADALNYQKGTAKVIAAGKGEEDPYSDFGVSKKQLGTMNIQSFY